MFSTFSYGNTSPRTGAAAGREDGAPARSKRSQVRRACDWCKLMRIKCDSHRPCYNCQQAGRECAISGENQFRSIAAAVKEVERLRAQVREFESTAKTQKQQADSSKGSPSPSASSVDLLELSRRVSLSDSYAAAADRPSASRNGVRIDSIIYGVASLPFFLTRMGQFLQTSWQRSQPLDISICAGGPTVPPQLQQPDFISAGYLPRAQEEHFLDLFWHTHYFSFPILNEGQFRRDYKALWADTNAATGAAQSQQPPQRKPSPLVDIILALCIQLGNFPIRQIHTTGSDFDSDSSRHNNAIDQTIESPSLTTVQCYIFSIVYLYEAGLLNRAQVVAGKAIMMAMILGLPHEPLASESPAQKEICRRTWWSLYILDAKLSMEVGRPPMIGPSHSTCHLPTESPEVAASLGPHYTFDSTCPTWLGYQTQALRLLDVVRTVRSVLYSKYDVVVSENGYADFVANGSAREECARLLTDHMKDLTTWTKQVPSGYILPRRDGGQPYSMDRSPLDISPDILIHCQRQRLLLELQYHQHCMTLYQPFICFATSIADASTPHSDAKAAAGLQHAMTLTHIVHQALTTSDILSGVHHVFRWVKNALFTTLGYAYTFPISHATTTQTRRTIETAIAIVDMYRDILPEADTVAQIARILADDVDALIGGYRSGSGYGSWAAGTNGGTTTSSSLASSSLIGIGRDSISSASSSSGVGPLNAAEAVAKVVESATAAQMAANANTAAQAQVQPQHTVGQAPGGTAAVATESPVPAVGYQGNNNGIVNMEDVRQDMNLMIPTTGAMGMGMGNMGMNGTIGPGMLQVNGGGLAGPTGMAIGEEMLDFGFLHDLELSDGIVTNWDNMDMLWTNLSPGEGSNPESWTSMGGDVAVGGMG
ncbi:fungal-specific transcription factor domain-containing protein [Bombardia bombarda]|uniref:Fungal-specific transcription factor domain-containing protein n=1 Tax=Bombardia bombarda TaxID=252184 RepID=A0AA40CEB5_9PEZI|nr:fungal-specific transcription factor domain-containing protein [Bombardia bombarda]